MNNTKLMKLVPINYNTPETNNVINFGHNLENIIKIALKLSKVKEINSTIIQDIKNLFDDKKDLNHDFINLLSESSVLPDDFTNENAKEQLRCKINIDNSSANPINKQLKSSTSSVISERNNQNIVKKLKLYAPKSKINKQKLYNWVTASDSE